MALLLAVLLVTQASIPAECQELWHWMAGCLELGHQDQNQLEIHAPPQSIVTVLILSPLPQSQALPPSLPRQRRDGAL